MNQMFKKMKTIRDDTSNPLTYLEIPEGEEEEETKSEEEDRKEKDANKDDKDSSSVQFGHFGQQQRIKPNEQPNTFSFNADSTGKFNRPDDNIRPPKHLLQSFSNPYIAYPSHL
jgi:hypothetical protein